MNYSHKKEQFRMNIRKQRNEDLFREIRNKTPKIKEQFSQTIIINQPEGFQQKNIEEESRLIRYEDIKLKLSENLTIEIIEFLSSIIQNLSENDFNYIFEEYNLAERVLKMYNAEKDLQYLEKIQYLLGQISKKSLLGQATLIRMKILPSILNIIQNLEIEFDDYFMNSLILLLTTFVEKLSRLNFEEVKQTIKIFDILCLKLKKINYLEALTENDQKPFVVLKNLLRFLKLYIDRSAFETNLTSSRNVWCLVSYLAFEQESDYSLRLLALQVISESLKIDEQSKLDILYYEQNILQKLINLMINHKHYDTQFNSIRANCSKIIKNLMSVNRPYAIGFIHNQKYPIQFLQLIQDEQYHIVLLNMLEAFKFICFNSSFDQCEELYYDTPNSQSLLTIMTRCFQEMKETSRHEFAKPLIEVTYGLTKQFEKDNNLKDLLKQHRIDHYLNDIVQNCRNQVIASKTNTLLLSMD